MQPTVKWSGVLCGLLTWGAVLLTGIPARAELYSLTDLGALGGNFGQANSINAAGQVVGSSTLVTGASHAFVVSNGSVDRPQPPAKRHGYGMDPRASQGYQ